MAYSTVTFNGGQPANITFVALHSIDTAPWQFVDLGDVSGRLRHYSLIGIAIRLKKSS
jgi:hypothetical protein